jgi:anti-anti-sigma regulatory factor
VPIIGTLDRDRGDVLVERILAAIAERRAARVILDLTGADTFDDEGVDRLRHLVGAIRLLGARPVITGVSPDLARALTLAGTGIAGATILRSLGEGLAARR